MSGVVNAAGRSAAQAASASSSIVAAYELPEGFQRSFLCVFWCPPSACDLRNVLLQKRHGNCRKTVDHD
jgi:hypothetical protein